MKKKILIFNPGTEGGIPAYAHCQAQAFSEIGWNVVELCDQGSGFKSSQNLEIRELLFRDCRKEKNNNSFLSLKPHRIARIVVIVWGLFRNQFTLFSQILKLRPAVVLFSSYSEYLSPFWAPAQWLLARLTKTKFLACLHDPVRDFKVGPDWWHRLSVRMAYWPLSAVFAHDTIPAEANVPQWVRTAIVPHGLFDLTNKQVPRNTIRREWDVPDDAIVFLSLGFIRDGKNLDLVIQALPHTPSAYLVIMGRVQSESSNRPVSYYSKLAEEHGVADRVRIQEAFLPDELLISYFTASDVIVMTYSGDFRSQSGVLNVATHAKKPLLVSSGEGPLKSCVKRFQLGVFVIPDNQTEIDEGLNKLYYFAKMLQAGGIPKATDPKLDWEGYRKFASWKTNVMTILETANYKLSSTGHDWSYEKS